MKNQIEESYNKILILFREHKRDTEEYKKELEKFLDLTKDNKEYKHYFWEVKFRLAKFYQEKHKYDLSKILFLELINNTETDDFKLEAINQLAYNLRILKKHDEAMFWSEKLLELSSSKSKYYQELALEGIVKCEAMTNNFEKERKNYYNLLSDCLNKEEIKKLSEKIINLKNSLLNIKNLEKNKKVSDEINSLEEFLNSSYYKLIDIRMKIARSYFNEKKYQDCRNEIQIIFEFLKYTISDMQEYAITNANMLLGKTYFEEGNYIKAREYFEPIANTSKEEKYYKYMISDIHTARNFLTKMK